MKKLIAACLLTLSFAAACGNTGSSSNHGNGVKSECSQFGGAKQTSCEKGLDSVKSAVDQIENGG